MNVEDELKHGKLTRMSQDAIRACPFMIMDLEHYRSDGTCKCNDVNDKMMAEWGYTWDDKLNQWVGDDNDV